jgi:hypothetical protein
MIEHGQARAIRPMRKQLCQRSYHGPDLLSTMMLLSFLAGSSGCFALQSPDGGSQATFTGTRTVDVADVALPIGYWIEAIATGLTFPTDVAFDDHARVYITEAGYSYGEVWDIPRLIPIEPDGGTTVIAAQGGTPELVA